MMMMMMMTMMLLMMKMMILCPKGFYEVVSRCLPHQSEEVVLVSNLSKAATQWLEIDSNLRPSGCKAQNIPLHHHVPLGYVPFKQNYITDV